MTHRTMTQHKLEPIRNYREGSFLCRGYPISQAQIDLFSTGYVPAGRCFHQNAAGEMVLGVAGHAVAHFLFRPTDSYTGGYGGIDPASPDAASGGWVESADRIIRFYNALGNFELQTTEFVDGNYNINDFLTSAVTTGTTQQAEDTAGKITNVGVEYGKTPVVGIVSAISTSVNRMKNMHQVPAVQFYTLFAPPIEAIDISILDGEDEPTWAV